MNRLRSENQPLVSGSPLPAYSINPTEYAYSPEDPYAPFAYENFVSNSPVAPKIQGPAQLDDQPLVTPNMINEIEDNNADVHFEPYARKPFVPPSDSAMYNRMRYYTKLSGTNPENQRHFELPSHVLPAESLVIFPSLASIYLGTAPHKDGEVSEGSKRGDITLIFSIWNTMMGSSLLALPWAFTTSGFITGLVIIFLMGALCCYTCLLILRHGKESGDFFYLCYDYMGELFLDITFFSSMFSYFGI
jgi:solute carrier family 38 (sodium-coupled neutral amino acid transporter), member 9